MKNVLFFSQGKELLHLLPLAMLSLSCCTSSVPGSQENTASTWSEREERGPGKPANTDANKGFQVLTTDENYSTLLERSHQTPVLLMFSHDKCSACSDMLPFVKAQNEKDNHWIWAYTDTMKTKVKIPFKLKGVPTLVMIWKGKEVDRELGFCDENKTLRAISRMLLKAKG